MQDSVLKLNFADMATIKAEAPLLYMAIENISQNSEQGKKLISWLQETKVSIHLSDQFELLGQCLLLDSGPQIQISTANKKIYEGLIVHEGFHALQSTRGVFHLRCDESLESLVLDAHLLEAGANTCSAMVLHQMKQNGVPKPFDYQLNNKVHLSSTNAIYRMYERHYDQAVEMGIKDPLAYAAQKSFAGYFKSKALLDDYNDSHLILFVDQIDEFAKHKVKNLLDNKRISKYALYFDGLDFSKDFDLKKAQEEVFANNPDLRNAVDWLTYHRLVKYHKGKEDVFDVILKRQWLARNNNPYLSIAYDDFETEFLLNLDRPSSEQYEITRILNILSGDEKEYQQHFNFSKPFLSKRSNR